MNVISRARLKKIFKKFNFYHSDSINDYDSFVKLSISDVLNFNTNLLNTKSKLTFREQKGHLRVVRCSYEPSKKPSFRERCSFSYYIRSK